MKPKGGVEVHGLGFPIAVCFLTTSVFSFFYQSVIFPFFFFLNLNSSGSIFYDNKTKVESVKPEKTFDF